MMQLPHTGGQVFIVDRHEFKVLEKNRFAEQQRLDWEGNKRLLNKKQ